MLQLVHRLQTVVTSLFPLSSATLLDVNVSVLDERLTALWLKLKDVEASHALSYQWAGSAANKCLLMALGIDSRNIVSLYILMYEGQSNENRTPATK